MGQVEKTADSVGCGWFTGWWWYRCCNSLSPASYVGGRVSEDPQLERGRAVQQNALEHAHQAQHMGMAHGNGRQLQRLAVRRGGGSGSSAGPADDDEQRSESKDCQAENEDEAQRLRWPHLSLW